MGHEEETTMTVATEEKGGGTLRRMFLVSAAAAVMALLVMASAVSAFAVGPRNGDIGNPNPCNAPCASGTFYGPVEVSITTYMAPTAEGAPPPGSSAAGGNPQYAKNRCAGTILSC